MLVVDLLHEFELGVWKSVFVHLIRILYAAGRGSDELVVEFDKRYASWLSMTQTKLTKWLQIPSNLIFWGLDYQKLQQQYLGNEETGRTGL